MKKALFVHLFAFLIVFALGATIVSAQGGNNQSGSNQNISPVIENPFNCGGAGGRCNLFTFINVIVDKVVLPLGGILVVLAFIWSGFMYVTAQGNSTGIEKANRALLYTAIGTAILLGAKVLTSVISNTVNSLRA